MALVAGVSPLSSGRTLRATPGALRSGVIAAALAVGCASARLTPAQEALRTAGDCPGLLTASDGARAAGDHGVAAELAAACPQAGLDKLVAAATPADGLLWCGRAAASTGRTGKPACDLKKVAALKEALRPHLTLGPADSASPRDPLLRAALEQLGPELNLAFNEDPDVIVGRLEVKIERQQTSAFASVPDPTGKRRQVPGTNHRVVARAQAQVELQERTRTLRASEEARDTTWEAVPKWKIAARPDPEVPPDAELQRRAAITWLRQLAKALWLALPETVDTDDARGCVAYGLALNAQSGDPEAAANRRGDQDRITACERLLGLPHGAGLPVP